MNGWVFFASWITMDFFYHYPKLLLRFIFVLLYTVEYQEVKTAVVDTNSDHYLQSLE